MELRPLASKVGDWGPCQNNALVQLSCAVPWHPTPEAGSLWEWPECEFVKYEENTQLHTHVKARNSLTSGHKPTTNFLYVQVIPYLFVLGVLVPFPQASGVCLSWRKDARLDRLIMASFWYGNYCIPPWKRENTLGKARNVRWQVPITHGPIK